MKDEIIPYSRMVAQWQHSVYPLKWSDRLTLDECGELVRQIWAMHRPTRPPGIRDGRGCSNAHGGRQHVYLPKWTRVRWIVLHEVAHSLTISEDGCSFLCPNEDDHGPSYIDAYIAVMAGLGLGDRQAMMESARLAGIEVASPTRF